MKKNTDGTPNIKDDPDYGKPWLGEGEEESEEETELMEEETELMLEDGTQGVPDYRSMAQNRKHRDLSKSGRTQRPQRP